MRKIFTSIITLVLMVAVLATGVFAWFTINTKTEASGLAGQAEAVDGGFLIQVTEKGQGANEDAWATSVDLGAALKDLLKELKFTDVTTKSGDLTTLQNFDESDATANTDYVEFDFHFLTGATRKNVVLTNLDISTSTATTWVSELDIEYNGVQVEKGDILEAKLSDAMRVSFTQDTTTTIFENPAETTEISKVGTTVTFGNTTGFGGFALEYYNSMNSPIHEVPTHITNRGDKVLNTNTGNTLVTTQQNDNVPTHDFDKTFNHYSKVTVRVWLEGWDGQAFNAVASGNVTINFEFEVRED